VESRVVVDGKLTTSRGPGMTVRGRDETAYLLGRLQDLHWLKSIGFECQIQRWRVSRRLSISVVDRRRGFYYLDVFQRYREDREMNVIGTDASLLFFWRWCTQRNWSQRI